MRIGYRAPPQEVLDVRLASAYVYPMRKKGYLGAVLFILALAAVLFALAAVSSHGGPSLPPRGFPETGLLSGNRLPHLAATRACASIPGHPWAVGLQTGEA
jgi:hypothetical protein